MHLQRQFLVVVLFVCMVHHTISVDENGPEFETVDNDNQLKAIDLTDIIPTGVQFYAYTNPASPDTKTEIKIGDKKGLQSSGLVPGEPVKIYMHGFLGVYNDAVGERSLQIKDDYLKAGLHNVILVNWQTTLPLLNEGPLLPLGFVTYFLALWKYIPQACATVASFLDFLRQNQFSPDSIHLIGHSLGAHLGGCVGKRMKKEYHVRLNRVTGLDPAGVFLDLIAQENRLSKSSASFVDVLHTCTDIQGTPLALGHVDFYASGGLTTDQTGCVVPGPIGAVLLVIESICAHIRSNLIWSYIAQAGKVINAYPCDPASGTSPNDACIRPKPFNSSQRVRFMENLDRSLRGKYYLPITKSTFVKMQQA